MTTNDDYQRYVIVKRTGSDPFFYNSKTYRWSKEINNASFHSFEVAKKQTDVWKEHRVVGLYDAVVMKVQCHDV